MLDVMDTDKIAEATDLIDKAIEEISGQSVTDTSTMIDLLLDVRLAISPREVMA